MSIIVLLMKNYIPIIADTLFCALCLFIALNFIFALFLSQVLSLIFSATLSLLFGLLFFRLLKRKSGKKNLKKAEEKKMKEALIRLTFMKRTSLLEFFERIFAKINVRTEIVSGRIYLPEHGAVIFLRFDFDEVRKSEFIKYCNLLHGDEIGVIFATSFPQEIKDFALNFNGKIKLFGGSEVYKLLSRAEIFPENDVYFFKEKEKKWDFSLLLGKKRARNYFLFGIIFLLYSFIVPIKVYYIVVGSLFLIFSLIVKLFGKKEKEEY